MPVLKFTPKRRKAFLEELTKTANTTHAAKVVGVSRRTVHYFCAKDPEFKKLHEEAVEAGTDALVAEARRRAHEGFEEPVFYQGKQVGAVRKWSDNLLMFLIKERRPEYRERFDLKHEMALPLVILKDYTGEHGGMDPRQPRSELVSPAPPQLPPGPTIEVQATTSLLRGEDAEAVTLRHAEGSEEAAEAQTAARDKDETLAPSKPAEIGIGYIRRPPETARGAERWGGDDEPSPDGATQRHPHLPEIPTLATHGYEILPDGRVMWVPDRSEGPRQRIAEMD